MENSAWLCRMLIYFIILTAMFVLLFIASFYQTFVNTGRIYAKIILYMYNTYNNIYSPSKKQG